MSASDDKEIPFQYRGLYKTCDRRFATFNHHTEVLCMLKMGLIKRGDSLVCNRIAKQSYINMVLAIETVADFLEKVNK